MKKQINWGIIGLGKIARKFASDLQLSTDAVLYAVASRDGEKAASFAREFRSRKHYSSYEELAKDPEVDVVYIATPHNFHFAHSIMCLENGKAVLCEKPMGVNPAGVQKLVETARSKKLFLMEALWTRFIPATEKLIELLNEKVIGDIFFVRADFGFKAKPDPEGRLFNKDLAGGALLDIGIYPVYLSYLSLGAPSEIKAMARMSATQVDTFCSMLFHYKNDAKAILEVNIEANTPTEAYIYGSEGSIKLHKPFHHSEKISLYRDHEPEETFDLKYKGYGFSFEIEEVHNCLYEGRIQSSKLPHQLSLKLAGILEAVRVES